MIAICWYSESRVASAFALALRTALYCAESLTALVSRASSRAPRAVWLMNSRMMRAAEAPAAPTAPSMYLSVILPVRSASQGGGLRLNSNFVEIAVLDRFFFLPSPGRRLISIMVLAPGSVLAKREADREHQERRDLVGHE